MSTTTVAAQPASGQSTSKVFDSEKIKAAINKAFEQSEPALISTARVVSGSAFALIINQGIDQTKTVVTNSGHEYGPIANAVLEIAKVPLATSAQASVPNFSEGSVTGTLQSFKGAAHKSVDVVDRSFTSINL